MPSRHALGIAEISAILKCILYYKIRGLDPGYDGVFERNFCRHLESFFGVKNADAVATGTGAIYIALKALRLKPGSIVATSPVTEASVVSCIIEQGLTPLLIDSDAGSYNISAKSLISSLKGRCSLDNIQALIVTHAGGEPVEMAEIKSLCNKFGIRLIEDISQAIGARCKDGQIVGTFGDFAVSSTMYRKNLSAGGASGFYLCKDDKLFKLARQYADRGKHWWSELDLRDPGNADFPALNWNTDEISCAIGEASLRRLNETNAKRRAVLALLVERLKSESKCCSPYNFHSGFSPFYFPIHVNSEMIVCSVDEFAEMLQLEGIGVGIRYGCLVGTWRWAYSYMFDDYRAPNALMTRDSCFHLYLNERYKPKEIAHVIKAIRKVEEKVLRRNERGSE